jgi:hypothetical protein
VLETDLLLSAMEFIYGSRVRSQKEIDRLALAMGHNPKSAATPDQMANVGAGKSFVHV